MGNYGLIIFSLALIIYNVIIFYLRHEYSKKVDYYQSCIQEQKLIISDLRHKILYLTEGKENE
jgi:hypothetical protein